MYTWIHWHSTDAHRLTKINNEVLCSIPRIRHTVIKLKTPSHFEIQPNCTKATCKQFGCTCVYACCVLRIRFRYTCAPVSRCRRIQFCRRCTILPFSVKGEKYTRASELHPHTGDRIFYRTNRCCFQWSVNEGAGFLLFTN